jgi:hypothetical protein
MMPSDPNMLLAMIGVAIVIMLLLTLVNLGLVALMFKLYTEILKDQSQNRRVDKGRGANVQTPTT